MSTSVVCPKCGRAASYFRPPVAGCRHCQAPYPETLRRSAEQVLLVEAPQRPWLLGMVLLGTGLFAVIAPIFLVLAPFDVGSYTINNETVSGPEFLRRAGLVFAAGAACSVAIAYGLWQERPWARELMFGSWLLAVIAGATSLAEGAIPWEALIAVLQALLMTAAAAWYLYRKRNVVVYFETLKHLSTMRRSSLDLSRGGGA